MQKTLLLPLNLRFFDEGAAGQQTAVTPPAITAPGATQTPAAGATQTAAQTTQQPPAGQPPKTTETAGQQPPAQPAGTTPEKTFTQAELDFIISERLKRAKQESSLSPDELKAFNTWKDSQKTEQQRHTEELAKANKLYEEANSQLNSLKQMEAIRKAGVDESFVGYVHYEATNQAKASNTTFDEALMTFMKNGDKYKRQETRTVTAGTDTPPAPQTPSPFSFNFTGVRPKPGNGK